MVWNSDNFFMREGEKARKERKGEEGDPLSEKEIRFAATSRKFEFLYNQRIRINFPRAIV